MSKIPPIIDNRKKTTCSKKQNSNGAGLEQTLWLAADKLRKNIDAAE